MFPTICRIGPVAIHSFGVMVAIAAIICSLLMARESKRFGMSPQDVYDLVFWSFLGGIIGARIFFILLNISFFMETPSEILMLQNGGLAWQGGLVGGALVVFLFIRYKKWPVLRTADFVAPYLALGHAIGRVGCFLNGCCYGKEVTWGIFFPVHHAHLHPTQLYEMLLLTALFFGLRHAQKVLGKSQGGVFALYLMLSSLIRFSVEFFRADHQPLFLNLSVFQYVSVVIFVVGTVMFLYIRRDVPSERL
jgi:phosphatidylglycerol:prolipoprotein diacylglycerol transferase